MKWEKRDTQNSKLSSHAQSQWFEIYLICMYHFFSLFSRFTLHSERKSKQETHTHTLWNGNESGAKKKWSYTHPMKCKVLQFVTVKCDYDDFITPWFFFGYMCVCEFEWVVERQTRERERERKLIMRNITLWRCLSLSFSRNISGIFRVSHSNRKRKCIYTHTQKNSSH